MAVPIDQQLRELEKRTGYSIQPAEWKFVAAMRTAHGQGVGLGWMQQIIEWYWRSIQPVGALGPAYYEKRIAQLEKDVCGKWIPVTNEKSYPPEMRLVLVTYKRAYSVPDPEIEVVYRRDGEWLLETGGKVHGSVTAWMPLPEAYQEPELITKDVEDAREVRL